MIEYNHQESLRALVQRAWQSHKEKSQRFILYLWDSHGKLICLGMTAFYNEK